MASGLEHLKAALEFEKEGFEYYQKAAEATNHPQARSMFLLLKDEEQKHGDYLLELHGRLSAQGAWPPEVTLEMERDFKMIFKEAREKIDENVNLTTTDREALQFAVDLENRGRAMYQGLAEKAETPQEKDLYARLADWEQAHAAFAEAHLEYFSDKGLFMDE